MLNNFVYLNLYTYTVPVESTEEGVFVETLPFFIFHIFVITSGIFVMISRFYLSP